MMKNNNSIDKIIDILIDEGASLADENIGKSLTEPEEDIIFSERHEKQMEALFKHIRYTNRRNAFWYIRQCVCIILISLTVLSISVFSVKAWRIRFLNFVMDMDKPNTDYKYDDGSYISLVNNRIKLEYIPKNYIMVKSITDDSDVFLKFENGKEYFTVTVESIDGISSIDTENAEIERLTINNNDAVYTYNQNINTLVWGDSCYSYTIIGNINRNEIVKIAENIKM